ncbi:hypothetical protein [Mycobacterium arosiense]|uniref:hypothetical protein n=1 Tax=Mycobacterium arosiense TaxID=425468 RepID=UPI00115122EB|nr:hypothetical protein [Mycobacterium arosiense]
MRTMRTTANALATLVVAAGGVGLTGGPSNAEPSGHQVTYRVTSLSESYVHISFMAKQPMNEQDYAENSQQYLYTLNPKVNQDAPWSYTTQLANPGRWAYLAIGPFYKLMGRTPIPPEVLELDFGLRCEIAVDGQVVHTQNGAREAACGTVPISHIEPGTQIQPG